MSRADQYLLVVYRLARGESSPVAPGRVADTLDRSPAATTEMLQRLEDRGLLEREPYEGVTLTPAGRERAVELAATHETLASFFEEVLRLEDPEREALRLAGTVSPAVSDRLATTLLEEPSPDQSRPAFAGEE